MPAVQNGSSSVYVIDAYAYCSQYRVTAIADKLGLEFALFHRKRDGKKPAEEVLELLVGDVKGKVCFPDAFYNRFHVNVDSGRLLSSLTI